MCHQVTKYVNCICSENERWDQAGVSTVAKDCAYSEVKQGKMRHRTCGDSAFSTGSKALGQRS